MDNLGRAVRICVLLAVLLTLCVGAAWGFSIAKEIKLGEDISKEVEKEMPLSKNEQWQHDIDAMGKKFVPYLERKDIPYHFHIVDAKDEINAFSVPGGYVYFTERMWKILTPDERAGVLGHEIAHSDKRHAVDQMIGSTQRALWTIPIAILTGGAGLDFLLAGNMAMAMRYSRKMEREADEVGTKLMQQAGYNPAGMVTAMKKLLHIEAAVNHYEISQIFSSHPDTGKRIDYLGQEAKELGARPDELDLKYVEAPSCLGNITGKLKDINVFAARTASALNYGQKVQIRKVLWDDKLQALTPQPIAEATVLTPGTHPTLVVATDKEQSFIEVMEGDGIFAMDQAKLPEPTAKTEATSP